MITNDQALGLHLQVLFAKAHALNAEWGDSLECINNAMNRMPHVRRRAEDRGRARPPDSRHRGFNQEADFRIAGPRSSNTAGVRYLHQECRRVVLYLVHQRKTSRRQINWLAKVLES